MTDAASLLATFLRERRWLWVLCYVALSIGLAAAVPAMRVLGEARSLLGTAADWTLSPGMRMEQSAGGWRLRSVDAGAQTASRLIPVSDEVRFLRVRACAAEPVPAAGPGLYLASERAGQLDFNRHFVVRAEDPERRCFSDLFPRRQGDGVVVFQLQLRAPGPVLGLLTLEATALEHNPLWKPLRRLMLALGLALIAWWFSSYAQRSAHPATWPGLMVVAGILFGCTVSVALKADIYALLTGPAQQGPVLTVSELLREVFPGVGSSLFTRMHALLFGAACFFLSIARKHAWADLALLAMASETLQLFVPGRGPGFGDVLVDWSGVAAGALLLLLLRRSQRIRLLLQQ